MNEAVRHLRHELLNQVNHIVGYAELLLEEAEDAAQAGPLVQGLGEIRGAGKQVMAAVNRILDPGVEAAYDSEGLQAALGAPLGQVTHLAGELAPTSGEEATRVLDQIAGAARRALQLAAEGATGTGPPVSERPLASRPASQTEAESAAPSGRGLVLVVDDDAANRDVLARRLGRLGYAVREAENGREALDVMAAEPVDLVLLDLNMPELDGYGVLERRQADPALRDIPAIMISASADIDSVVRCIEMGAEDHLGKPFDPVLLEARVGACLEKKRLRDQERELLATVSRQAEALAEWNETLEARVAEQVEELEHLARLRRFLSPQLADMIAKGDDNVLRTHRRDIAVLFVDLSGFTAFSEVSEPEDVMAVLSEFHEDVGQLIDEFEATVGFFAGDGLMVFWNDPLPCPDPAERAVRMAVAMRERVAERTRAWRKRGHDLGFAIGVSLGYATLGEIGFEGRFDYGVIGSVVNLAARLCDHADRGQILISQRVQLAVEDVAELEELGLVSLKGFHAPVPAFAVTGLREPA
ncbi:MAG: response regulator [Actinomycetota bacterium]|nr:response regulator [Actinomycetota bacterium]